MNTTAHTTTARTTASSAQRGTYVTLATPVDGSVGTYIGQPRLGADFVATYTGQLVAGDVSGSYVSAPSRARQRRGMSLTLDTAALRAVRQPLIG